YLPLALSWNGVRVSGLMPYTWFVRIPGLGSFREADRLAILGLVPAALLAGAAVNWLRYHAKPLLVVVLALGILEAGYSGSAKVGRMPTSYPKVDRQIWAGPPPLDEGGPADCGRPRALDRGGHPVRHAGRDPGLRLAVLRQGAGDGHRGWPPPGDLLHLPGPEVRHHRDSVPPLLLLPEPHAASAAADLPLGAARAQHPAPGPPDGGHRVPADAGGDAGEQAQALPGPTRRGPPGRQPHACRVGGGLEAEHQHQRLRSRLLERHRLLLLVPGRQRSRLQVRARWSQRGNAIEIGDINLLPPLCIKAAVFRVPVP